MPFVSVYISDADEASFEEASAELGRTVDDLMESGLSEAVCTWRRNRVINEAQARLALSL